LAAKRARPWWLRLVGWTRLTLLPRLNASSINSSAGIRRSPSETHFWKRPMRFSPEVRMRCASVIYAATVACLAGVFASASVRPDVFDFSFGPQATGTFTTGAAANDPGYELITGLTFDVFKG
jgi:hypothetical protein